MFKYLKHLLIVGLLAFTLSACVSPLRPEEQSRELFEPWQEDFGEYKLEPGDEIDIKFIHNPEFSDRIMIGPDGRVHLPLVGAVRAEGKTATELAQTIESLFVSHFRRPETTVVPRSFLSQVFFVGGEVQKPGVQTFPTSRISVTQAVMMAGGVVPTANQEKVVVIRRHPDNHKPMLRIVNLRQILEGERMEDDFPLRRYDVVYIPRSDIAEVDLWVEQHINQVLPFTRSYTYTRTVKPDM